MKVTILGNNSALPAFGRHPTAQVVTVYGELLLIDCGEGTQIQMQRFGLKWRSMHHIFISHMHGDHYFGLPGLLNSMSLLGRTAPLHLYGPRTLKTLLDHILQVADTVLSYPFHFHELPDGPGLLVEEEWFKVSCFPVEHRIPCHGFLVERKTRGRKIVPERCAEFEIPATFYESLKGGMDYEQDGRVVKNEWVTEDGPQVKKYAYCADTMYTESYLPMIMGVDTLYHECTYLEQDAAKAESRYHSTAAQAATLASRAHAGQLLLGHFSSKYKDLEAFREEAGKIFPNSLVSVEGTSYEV